MPCQASSVRCSTRSSGGFTNWCLQAIAGATLFAIMVLLIVLALAFATGCARTVLVSEGSPVRIGPEMTGRIYTKTADGWQLSDNRVTVPEGWYCVPPSYVEAPEP
jgi:hypothetical protein